MKQLLGGAILAATGLAAAADPADDALARCMRIDDDATRLACYDRALQRGEPEVESILVRKPPEQPAPDAPAQVTADESPTADQAERQERRLWQRFLNRDRTSDGENAERADEKREREDRNREVAAGEIVRIQKLMQGNFLITLDNGQVWRENEYEPQTSYKVGDRVRVTVGFFGAHDLWNERTGQDARVRLVR